MDKYVWCFWLAVCVILRSGLISATGGFLDTIFSRRHALAFSYEFGNGSDDIRQRRLLQTTESATTVAVPPQEKDLLTKINEFYADKNNMAMFCVLPIMVVVYGGCSLIYCVAKLRRYIRKKNNRAAIRDDRVRLNNEEQNDLNSQDFTHITGGPPQPGVPPPPPPRPVHHGVSPPPWVVQNDPMVQPMVPPISSYHPAKPRDRMSRHYSLGDDRRRNYKDLLHIKPSLDENYDDENRPRIREAYRMTNSGDDSGRSSVQSYKDELMARYDALSTYSMARRAASILRTGSNNKAKEQESDVDIFNGKPRQKMIFIAE